MVDHASGDIEIETVEAQPQPVRLPRSFWNAKGRRRLALAYCRTIHKAQGATYRGQSFTLAGDDTINLEAVHVALSRATEANHLYYMGEPPPDEDHHLVEAAAEPELGRLIAAAGRSVSQVMAVDLLEGLADWLGIAASSPPANARGTTVAEPVASDTEPNVRRFDPAWADAPMTEAHAATLARLGVEPIRASSWVESSLLIDLATGGPRGERARSWLREQNATEEQVADVAHHCACPCSTFGHPTCSIVILAGTRFWLARIALGQAAAICDACHRAVTRSGG